MTEQSESNINPDLPRLDRRSIGALVVPFIKQFPEDTPRLTLAKAFVKKYPDISTNVERIRSIVRYYTGSIGRENRMNALSTSPDTIREKGYKIKIPKSDARDYIPAKLSAKKVLIITDLHMPYHDEKALDTIIEFGYSYGPDTILLNGDMMDCYQCSHWVRNPSFRDMAGELEIFSQFLCALKERYPASKLVWKFGNHEQRWENYLLNHAPAITGTPLFSLEKNVPAVEECDVEIVKDKRIVLLGKLPVVHGHEFKGNAYNPVNAARGLFLRSNHTALTGHWHQTADHVERNITDKIITCWSMGCACDLHPEYAPINKTWNHGFATVDVPEDLTFSVKNYRIYNGRIL